MAATPRRRRPPRFEEIEPRLLYAADMAALSPVAAAWAPQHTRLLNDGLATDALMSQALDQQLQALLADLGSQPLPVMTREDTRRSTPAPREVVFIDGGLANAADLASRWREAATQQGKPLDVVVLDAQQDGVAQVSDWLARSPALQAVHLVSHGAAGQVRLGNAVLDSNTLAARSAELQGWASHLAAGADLMVYGCDVAASPDGQALMAGLHSLTGADVAASLDRTGAAAQGGNWQLESTLGNVQANWAGAAPSLQGWQGTLATFTVTSSADTNTTGTLRWAINQANATAGADTIAFSGVSSINLTALLPQINGQVSINGANVGGTPGVTLNGGGTVTIGLDLVAGSDGSTVRGLVLQNFSSRGLFVEGASNVTIAGNYIGTDAGGNFSAANLLGIDLFNAAGAVVGGSTAADRNVISGNSNIGLNITGANSTGIVVKGNYIGTGAGGTSDVGNTNHGVYVNTAAGVTIGGSAAGEGNVISGQNFSGVTLDTGASGVTVLGNLIGLNALGSGTIANSSYGVWIQGANNTIGGTSAGARNVISANGVLGIRLSGTSATGNTILGNYIGTGTGGTTDLGNAEDGIQLDTGASNNTIGGTSVGARNVIGGNNNAGIALDDAATTGNIILGNWIGAGANGSTQVANSQNGINVNGATGTRIGDGTAAGRNVIAGNSMSGVGIIDATGTVVAGNWIVYNLWDGITVYSNTADTVIGGTSGAAGNLIAHNTSDGIMVRDATASATILANSIYANGQRGIDLADNGYDTNDLGDADTGANNLQNYPVLASASAGTAGTTVVGTLNSTANTNYRIDIYTNRPGEVDGSHGEGVRWVGSLNVSTNGSGNASFNSLLANAWINQGDIVTATATVDLGGGSYGATSEFALNITGTASGVVVVDTASETADGITTSITNLGNNRGGDGRISLREAITATNNTANGASPDRIVFAIPPNIESLNYNTAALSPTITLTSALSDITQALNLDASTQTGFAGTPLVQLRGNGAVAQGLTLAAGSTGSTLRGFIVGNFTSNGINVAGGNSHTIAGNWIGLARDGLTADANGQQGIFLSNSTGTTIGGTNTADRNVISANSQGNLYLFNAVNSVIYGNYIGTDATGMLDPDGNTFTTGRSGIYIDNGSTGNQIGNTLAGARNVISGNNWMGVDIITASATNNTISGNFIGTNATGLAALANAAGVSYWGAGAGNRTVANVLSGNAGAGVGVGNASSGAVIQGNYIGVGVDGATRVANGNEGVLVQSGATGTLVGTNADGSNDAAEANVISGNTTGILVIDVGTTGTLIQGNLIGTDASGLLDRGNSGDGIRVASGASNVTIGGTTVDKRNVISGNGGVGVGAYASNITILGNYVGLNAAGTAALGNDSYGIDASASGSNVTVGGAAAGAGNVVAGNGNAGVLFEAGASGSIKGNRIGTSASGSTVIAGNGAGVYLAASGVTVGGSAAGEGNTIAGSNTSGVIVAAGTGNPVLGNSIYANGGLAIDLGNNGVTNNDAAPDSDSGANNLQNFPVLVSARSNASNQIVLTGTLSSAANSFYRIEFYANSSPDASGHGEGQTYLGFANVGTGAGGGANFSSTLTANVALGSFISATATRASDNTYTAFTDTSEFSSNAAAIATTNPALVVDTTADTLDGDATSISTLLANKGADGFISLREAITAANNTANTGAADVIQFNIAGTGVHTINVTSALPNITDAVVLDASTDDSFAANGNRPAIVLDGNDGAFDGLQIAAGASGSTVRGLIVRNFGGDGIQIDAGSSGNTIAGNWIGAFDATGAALVAGAGNTSGAGVFVLGSGNTIGGTTAADRNLISANANGVVIDGAVATGNVVAGNYIGTGSSGLQDFGNLFDGVRIQNGASGNTVGGATTASRNVIAGNDQDGVQIDGDASDGNIVRNNWIGLGADGATVLGNGQDGILISAGSDNNLIGGIGLGNVIAGSGWIGVELWGNGTATSGNLIQGNAIGTDATGTLNFGGQQQGILFSSTAVNNRIGGVNAGEGNLVANNGLGGFFTNGVQLFDVGNTGNAILGNRIWGNAGLGIELGGNGNGVTPNDAGDADTGANNLQNYPVLALARTDGSGQVVVTGSISSAANSQYRIEFFASNSADPSGFGEGQTYLGFVNMNVGASGQASFNRTLAATLPIGTVISATATATDASFTVFGDTSEFSANVLTTAPNLAPQGSDAMVTTLVDTPYTFSAASFGFSDSDGSALKQVWIDTLPAAGTLRVFGTPISAGSSVGLAELNAGWLTYQPPAGSTATSSFTFRVQDDGGTALGGSDTDPSANTMTVRTAATVNAPEGLIAVPNVPATSLVGVYGFNRPADLGHDDANGGAAINFFGGPGQVSGPAGGSALNLAGGASGQYGDIAGISTGGAMTVSAWVRFDTTDSWQRVIDLGQTNSGGIGNVYIGREGVSNNLTFTIETNSGTLVTHRATATNAIVNGQWLHFTASVDAAGQMSLYVNGSLAASHAGMLPTVGVRDHNYIGRSNWAPDFPFDGAIDNLVILNGAVNAQQAAALYQQTSGFVVPEGAANGTAVATVRPFDLDNGDTFTYSLSDSAGGRFAIGANGTLTVADGSRLDYEAARTHNVTVRATDSAGLWVEQVLSIALSDVANAPVLNVPAAQTTTEDTARVFSSAGGNAITLTNTDSTGALNELTLAVDRGSLTLSRTTGLSFVAGDGSADTTMTLRGTLADINAALDGLAWQPAANDTASATLSLSAVDASLVRLNLDSALLGRYTFEGSSADVGPGTAQDAVLFNGAGYVTDGTRGRVLALDGVDDHAQITGTFGNPSEITIGGWVNLAAGSGRREFISLDNRVHIALDDPGIGVKGSVQVAPGTWVDLASNQFIAGTGWHHVMYSFSDSTNTHTLYIDGVQVASATINGSVDWAGASTTYIGRHPTGGFYPQARVDDVRIFNRVLGAAEVAALGQDQALAPQASVAVAVTAVNDAPVFSALNGTPAYTENAAPVVLDADVSVADADLDAAGAYTGATLTLSRNTGASTEDAFSATGTLGALVQGGALTVGGTTIGTVTQNGVGSLGLSFNANATGSLVNQALRQIAYQNLSDAPPASVQVNWLFNDGNSGAQGSGGPLTTLGSTTVGIAAVNDAPVFLGLDGTPTHTEGAAAVVMDANVSLFDHELGSANSFGGATLTLRRQGAANAQDVFGATGTLGALATGGAIVVGGTNVGTVLQNANGLLSLSFNAAATPGRLDQVMQQITYANASDAPPASVQIDWTFNDGNTGAQGSGGGLATSGSTTVTITATNDAPVLGATGGSLNYNENAGPQAIDSGLTVADADNATLVGATVRISIAYANGEDTLGFTDQNGISGSWNAATGTLTLSGTATLAQYQAALRSVSYTNGSENPSIVVRTVSFQVDDGAALSTVATRQVQVVSVNDAPIASDTSASGSEDAASIAVTLSGSDVDGTVTRFRLGSLPANGVLYTDAALTTLAATGTDLNASGQALTLYFVPDPNWNGSTSFSYTALDNVGAADLSPATATLNVAAVNDAPVNSAPATLVVNEDGSLAVTGVTLSDVDAGASLLRTEIRVGSGSLAATGGGGVTVSGSGTGTLVLTGTLVDLNAYLGGASRPVFSPAADFNGTVAMTVQTSDGQNSGTGGVRVAGSLDYRFVDGAPTGSNPDAIPASGGITGVTPAFAPGALANTHSGSTTSFGIVYSGVLDIGTAGSYSFAVNADDAATLYLDGSLVTSAFFGSSSNAVALGAGRHSLELRFAQDSGGFGLAVDVTGPDTGGASTSLFALPGLGRLASAAASTTITVNPVNDAPVVTASSGSLSHNENAPASVIDAGLTLSDVDSATLSGASVRISAAYAAAEDTLGFVNQAGISGSWNAGTGTLTLSGSATVAQYQAALRSVTYANGSENPSIAVRTVAFQVDDGAALSNLATRQVQVVSLNDAPAGNDTSASGSEDATSIAITLGGSDVDGTVTGFRLGSLPANGVLYTDAALTTPAAINTDIAASGQALTLYFVPAANWNGSTSFSYAALDDSGAVDPTPATAALNVAAVNDAPVLTPSSGALNYNENAAATAIDAGLSLSDVDSATLSGASVRISVAYAAAEDTLGFVNQAGISGSWNAGSGTLTLSGNATVAQYQAALRSVTYINGSENPSIAVRSVAFQVDDGAALSTVATRQVQVVSIDDAPSTDNVGASGSEDAASIAITLSGSDVDGTVDRFRLGSLPANGLLYTDAALTTLAAVNTDIAASGQALTLYFVPAANWNGSTSFSYAARDAAGMTDLSPATASLSVAAVNDAPVLATSSGTVSFTENGAPAVVDAGLTLNDLDSATLGGATVVISGNYANGQDSLAFVNQNGISGSWNAGTGTLTLSGAATLAQYQDALRSVTYANGSEAPSTATRTLDFQVSDGAASSNLGTRQVVVVGVNDAPSTNGTTASGNEGAAAIAITLTGSDVDGTVNRFRLLDLPANGLLYTDAALTTPAAVNTDLAASGQALTLYFKPTALWNGSTSFNFVAVDNAGGTDATPATATFTVFPVNDAPTLSASASALVYVENDGARAVDAGLSLADPDSPTLAGASVRLASGYVAGQDQLDFATSFATSVGISGSFNAATGTLSLSGAATQAQYQAVLRTVTYTNPSEAPATAARTLQFSIDDGAGGTATATRALTVQAVNDSPNATNATLAPVAEDTLSPAGATLATLFGPGFSDPDAGATLAGALVTFNPLQTAQGTWQYSTDGGALWNDLGAINSPSALALDAASRLRFVPTADYNGSPDALQLRVLDNSYGGGFTSGSNRVSVDASIVGGTSAVAATAVSLGTQVLAVNDAPRISSDGGGATAVLVRDENTTAVTTVVAPDVDSASVGYRIIGGADAARFAIDATTGALSFIAAPDFEAPADADANNRYEVLVQADDGLLADTQAITVRVVSVNEAPTLQLPTGQTVAEDQSLAVPGLQVADVDANLAELSLAVGRGSLNLNLAGGASVVAGANGSASLTLAGNGAQLNAALASLRYQGLLDSNGPDTLQLQVRDSLGLSASGSLAINVLPVNDAPQINLPAAPTLPEDGTLAFGGAATRITLGDVDAGNAALSLHLVAGHGTLSLAGTTGLVLGIGSGTNDAELLISGTLADLQAALDGLSFQAEPDFNGGASLHLTLDDGGASGGGAQQATALLAITVTPVNDAPQITSDGGGATAALVRNENAQAVTTVVASDIDSASLRYSIVGGADAARFAIDANTGVLSFITAPDAEAPSDADGNNIYSVQVQASDGALNATQTLDVTVVSVNEAPVFTLPAAAPGLEDTPLSLPGLVVADVDGNLDGLALAVGRGTLSLDLSGGATLSAGSNGSASLVLTGTQAQLNAALASLVYQGDLDANGADTLTLTALESGGPGTVATLGLNLAAVNDAPTLGGNASSLAVGTDEDNASAPISVRTLLADPALGVSDVDSTHLGLALVRTTGNGTWQYRVDGGAWTDVPTLSPSQVLLLPEASDLRYQPDGLHGERAGIEFLPWDRSSGTDSASGRPQLADPTSPAMQAALASRSAALVLDVAEVNDAPTAAGGPVNLQEDQLHTLALTDFGFSDPDDNALQQVFFDTLPASGTLLLDGQALAAGQAVDAAAIAAGRLQYNPAADANGDGLAEIFFRVQDDGGTARGGSNTTAQAGVLRLNVAAVNDAPRFVDDSAQVTWTWAENQADGRIALAHDIDSSTLHYRIVGGADAALFHIDEATGALSLLQPADFEAPADANGDNVFELLLEVDDGQARTEQALTVRLQDVNEAPVWSGPDTAVVQDNSTSTITVRASDPDSAPTLTYSIVGGDDAAQFNIDPRSGALSFREPARFFAPRDANADNVYQVQVQVSDGALTAVRGVSVTIAALPPAAPADVPAETAPTPAAPPPAEPVVRAPVRLILPAPAAPSSSTDTPAPAGPSTPIAVDSAETLGDAAVRATRLVPSTASVRSPAARLASQGADGNSPVEQAVADLLAAGNLDTSSFDPMLMNTLVAGSGGRGDAGPAAQANPAGDDNPFSRLRSGVVQAETAVAVLGAGFVWWSLRAAGLLATVLASAPVWRHLDPIPILGGDERERDDEDDLDDPDAEAARDEAASHELLEQVRRTTL